MISENNRWVKKKHKKFTVITISFVFGRKHLSLIEDSENNTALNLMQFVVFFCVEA